MNDQWLAIKFKNNDTAYYAPDEYTNYEYDGKYFIVIRNKQWIGFYNLTEIRYIEVITRKIKGLKEILDGIS